MVLRHLSNILCFLTWPNGIGNYLLQRVANIVPLESLQYIVYGPMHLSIVAIFGISELFCNVLAQKGDSSTYLKASTLMPNEIRLKPHL